MMKGKGHIFSVTEKVSQKGNKYYTIWFNIEGYEMPYRTNVFPDHDRAPVKDSDCIVYIDQDYNLNPIVRIRF